MSQDPDLYSHFGAGLLAKRIEHYWHERGARHVRAERFELPHNPGLWGVRSNLVAGKPPSRTLEQCFEDVVSHARGAA